MAKNAEQPTAVQSAHEGVKLSAHPRARKHLALAKGWGGILSFVIVAAAAVSQEQPMSDVLLRGLLAGIVGSMLAWSLTLITWRHIALAQIEGLRRKLVADIEAKRRSFEGEEDRSALEQRALAEAAAARTRAPEGALTPGS